MTRMGHMNLLAVLVAGLAAMILSMVYYIGFSRSMATLHPAYADPNARPAPWQVGVELLRSLVLAFVVSLLAHFIRSDSAGESVHLALLLWVGFPLVLWTGAVVWERVPRKLAAIHAGDWLLKLLVVAFIVSVWQ